MKKMINITLSIVGFTVVIISISGMMSMAHTMTPVIDMACNIVNLYR